VVWGIVARATQGVEPAGKWNSAGLNLVGAHGQSHDGFSELGVARGSPRVTRELGMPMWPQAPDGAWDPMPARRRRPRLTSLNDLVIVGFENDRQRG